MRRDGLVYVRRLRHFETGAMHFRATKREAISAPRYARLWAVVIAVPEEQILDTKDAGGMPAVKKLYVEAGAVARAYVGSGLADEIPVGGMIPVVYLREAQERMTKTA